MGAALFDIVVDVVDVEVIRDQAVQAIGVIDAIIDRIGPEFDIADGYEGQGHHKKADEQRHQYPDSRRLTVIGQIIPPSLFAIGFFYGFTGIMTRIAALSTVKLLV